MNISKFPVICLLATTLAFAQFPWEVQAAPVPSDSSVSSEEAPSSSSLESSSYYAPEHAPSSSSVATKPAIPEGKTIFDVLRGHAYNPYSTVGAASTVGDLVTIPSDINGQRFFYVSPTDRLGYTAFGLGGGSAMLGLDNSPMGSPAALILGYGTSSFGIALNYSVAKEFTSDDRNSNAKTSVRTTDPGDNLGLYFSMPMGSAVLYANGSWLTYSESNATDIGSKGTKDDYSVIEANVGLTDKFGSFNYDGYLNAIRTGGTMINSDDKKSIDEYTYLGVALNFDIGYAALQSSTAKVIVGANNRLVAIFYDKTDDVKSDNIMGLVVSPNILAEVSLFDNWLAFAGAMHALNIIVGDGDKDNKTSRLDIKHTDGTGAFAGIRYQRTNWAAEAQIATNMFNNPFGGFNGSNMFAKFGGFVYF
jgi:hypothetical protein